MGWITELEMLPTDTWNGLKIKPIEILQSLWRYRMKKKEMMETWKLFFKPAVHQRSRVQVHIQINKHLILEGRARLFILVHFWFLFEQALVHADKIYLYLLKRTRGETGSFEPDIHYVPSVHSGYNRSWEKWLRQPQARVTLLIFILLWF